MESEYQKLNEISKKVQNLFARIQRVPHVENEQFEKQLGENVMR
jgi:alpha-mannosidase